MFVNGLFNVGLAEKPQLLLRLSTEDGRMPGFDIVPETIETLDDKDCSISVVSIVGPYRTGKSWLMNKLMLSESEATGTFLARS